MGNLVPRKTRTHRKVLSDSSTTGLQPSVVPPAVSPFVVPQEMEKAVLVKKDLFRLLLDTKREAQKVYHDSYVQYRGRRVEYMQKYVEWGSCYEDLCIDLKEEYNRMVVHHTRQIERALKDSGKNILESKGIDEKLLESSVLHYAADPKILELVESANSFKRVEPVEMDLATLLEICKFRHSRYSVLCKEVKHPHSRALIIRTIICDEVHSAFHIEEEDFMWVLQNMSVPESSPAIQQFQQLTFLF